MIFIPGIILGKWWTYSRRRNENLLSRYCVSNAKIRENRWYVERW